jgi:hypothetical protein
MDSLSTSQDISTSRGLLTESKDTSLDLIELSEPTQLNEVETLVEKQTGQVPLKKRCLLYIKKAFTSAVNIQKRLLSKALIARTVPEPSIDIKSYEKEIKEQATKMYEDLKLKKVNPGNYFRNIFMQFKSPLEVSGRTPFNSGLLSIKKIEASSEFSDLSSIRDFCVRYALCNAINSDTLPKGLSRERVAWINPTGGVVRSLMNQMTCHLNYPGIRVSKKSREIKNMVASLVAGKDLSCCHCSTDTDMCEHMKEFKPTIIVSAHGDMNISHEYVIECLRKGITMVVVTYLFDPIMKEGSYGKGRWTEAKWSRKYGVVSFDNFREVYLQQEMFNKFLYTSTIAGTDFTANKVIEVDLGSFKSVGIVIRPLMTKTNASKYEDLQFGLELPELLKFKEANKKTTSEFAIMDYELSLLENTPILSKEHGMVLINKAKSNPIKEFESKLMLDEKGNEKKKEGKEYELIRNVKGRLYFSKFRKTDSKFVDVLLGLDEKHYGKSLLKEYLAYYRYSEVDHSFSISLEEYNKALAALLMYQKIDEEALTRSVSDALRSSFRYAGDPTAPLVLMNSLLIDITRIRSAVKQIPFTRQALEAQSIQQEVPDTLKEHIKEGVFGLNVVSGAEGKEWDTSKYPTIPDEWKRAYQLWGSTDNGCVAKTFLLLLLSLTELEDGQQQEALEEENYLETLTALIEALDLDCGDQILNLAIAAQPDYTKVKELIIKIKPDQRIIYLQDGKLTETGTYGYPILLGANHVEYNQGSFRASSL